MPTVYILQSESTGGYYVGSTVDLERRLSEHARQHSPYTSQRGPWKLVYQEQCKNLSAARQRERQIKSWKSRPAIEKLIASRSSG